MKLFKILFIGILMSTLGGCKPSLCEPDADNKACHFQRRFGFVNDYIHLMNADEIKDLEEKIAAFHSRTGIEIVIVIEDTRRSHSRKFHTPCTISKAWKIGQPEKCDDIIIAISMKRHYVDIFYGPDIKPKYTGEDHQNILFKTILPAFRKKRYYDGLNIGIDYIIANR